MNVQEAEKKTGLTRANIRFYEKQGLLKPHRKANSVFFYLMFHIEDSIASIVCFTVLGMAEMIIIESVLLSCFGTTVGKWLFGIRVLSKDGKRLTWREAAERTGMVLWHGLADEERLDRNGEWEEPQALKPRFRYELEDGIIKSVSFEIDYIEKEENPHYRDEVTCAALAWEGGKWKSKM